MGERLKGLAIKHLIHCWTPQSRFYVVVTYLPERSIENFACFAPASVLGQAVRTVCSPHVDRFSKTFEIFRCVSKGHW